jgi:hypothetical protein
MSAAASAITERFLWRDSVKTDAAELASNRTETAHRDPQTLPADPKRRP